MSSKHRRPFRRVNKTGRNTGPGSFVKLDGYVLVSPAYRSMKALPRAVYTELRRRFNGNNNGQIGCSVRSLSEELHCSKDSASKALRELITKGFIKCAQPGSFDYKIRHATTWILTEEGLGEVGPTKDFMRWRSEKEKPVPMQGQHVRKHGPVA